MEPEPGGTFGPDAYGEAWAEIYDEDHALMVPPDAQLSVLAELAGGDRALELGIGTGRVALPLTARGARSAGSMRRGRWWSACAPSRAARRSR